MRTRYDQLGKQMLRAGLAGRGVFTAGLEVSPDPQDADGYFLPDLSRPSPVAPTLLGHMTERACSLEMFSSPPDALEFGQCVRKHMNLLHILRNDPKTTSLPWQWIMSSGKPVSAMKAAWARIAPTWPRGVYDLPPMLATSVVVLNELPRERSTLFLRLMGRGPTLRQAIDELKLLAEDEFEKCIVPPLLVRFRIEAAAGPVSPEDEEFIVNSQEIVEMMQRNAEKRGVEMGVVLGKLDGRRETLLRLLQLKFGSLPRRFEASLRNAEPAFLDKLEEKLLFGSSLDDVLMDQ